MLKGWIKLHRKLLDSVVFQNEKGLKIWIWCLLKATHKHQSFLIGRTKVDLHPGEFVCGSNKATAELGIAKTTFWNWLHFLEQEGKVGLKKNAKFTLVYIKNWERYQHAWDAGGTVTKTQVERWVGTYNKANNTDNVKNDSCNVEKFKKMESPSESFVIYQGKRITNISELIKLKREGKIYYDSENEKWYPQE
ncbi:hypothetical protein KC799_02265 [candidate division KSB1 bacterium]|nr:hypothetical protein [candidate division KSB1 bacterium]